MSFRKIILSTAAMSAVNVLRLLAQFMAVPLLARLLSPADYGVIGIAMPFVLFVMMVADSGLGTSLVRTPPEQREEWSTCYWLSVMLGLGLAVIMALLAPLVSYFYNEPRLTPIVITLALIIFGQTAGLIPGAALQQAKRFGTIALIELASIMSSIAAAVLLALSGAGVWALVGQQVALYAVRMTGNIYFSPFRPIWAFKLGQVGPHVSFGRDVLGVNLINFSARAMENLVIGKILGAAPVGIYAMSAQFLRLPSMLLTGPLQYVLYSQLAPKRDDREMIRSTFLFLTRLVAIVVFPVMGLVAAAHVPVFHIVLSAKWAFSGQIFCIIMPAAAVQAVTALCGTIMLVYGRTDVQVRVASEMGAIAVLNLLISSWFGLHWVALGYVTIIILYTPRLLMLTLPVIDCAPMRYLRSILVPIMATSCGAVIYQLLSADVAMGDWAQAFMAAGIATVVVLVSALVQLPALKVEFGMMQHRYANAS